MCVANDETLRDIDEKEVIMKQNLEKLFRKRYPNRQFDYERELEKFVTVDSEKFKREYG
jgi:hypothetical protein